MKYIAVLGSTGSIGTQTLDVIRLNPDSFKVHTLTAGNNVELLIKQAIEFKPAVVVIADKNKYKDLAKALSSYPIKVLAGNSEIENAVSNPAIDIVLTAMVGFSGLLPTIKAIKANKTIALANKETLVVAGDIISELVKKHRVNIIPVDSEHSAIFQCLAGEFHNPVEKIYLTASGGPFRTKNIQELEHVTIKQALKHPNWDMGAKITIDSASMMNKGLEAIEAKWLFELEPKQIDIIIHPQSIIHSIVQFSDGSMKSQMGLPDMKLPIQYALTYPNRLHSDFERFNFINYPELTFEKPDLNKFKNIQIAYDAMTKGGNVPCVMNAANEIAVDAFLKEQIKFTEIPKIIEKTINKTNFVARPSVADYIDSDAEARKIANELIN
jgi:1-deoxy-D-xylulose-5-phosphate reductoisomerase